MRMRHWHRSAAHYCGPLKGIRMSVSQDGALVISGSTTGDRGHYIEAELSLDDMLDMLPRVVAKRDAIAAAAKEEALSSMAKNIVSYYGSNTTKEAADLLSEHGGVRSDSLYDLKEAAESAQAIADEFKKRHDALEAAEEVAEEVAEDDA